MSVSPGVLGGLLSAQRSEDRTRFPSLESECSDPKDWVMESRFFYTNFRVSLSHRILYGRYLIYNSAQSTVENKT